MKTTASLELVFVTALVSLLLLSCKKNTIKDNVYFSGRVTYACNGNPVKHCNVDAGLYYVPSETAETKILGSTTTDENGVYSFAIDFSFKGSFINYYVVVSGGVDSVYERVNNNSAAVNSNPVVTDCYIDAPRIVFFHVKNVPPSFANDNLVYLYTCSHSITNLPGPSVDTTLSCKTYGRYNYSFTYYTNGDTVYAGGHVDKGCFDTTYVDLFY
jgi:hypothetical protein